MELKPEKVDTQEALAKMKRATGMFYANAVHIGCHGFLEFTGLLNEYIKFCEDREAKGEDWYFSNKHAGLSQLSDYRKQYIREKLECIYGEVP